MRNQIKTIFRDPPILETKRLILRRMEPKDSGDMFEYACDPSVTRYLTWDPHPDEAYTRRYLSYISGRYKAGEFYDWALILKAENKMIGTCGFTRIDYKKKLGEIGYVINKCYWGQELATEAVIRVIQFAFAVLQLKHLEAHYMERNLASRRVMEKAGMRYEGLLDKPLFIKGQNIPVGVCSMTDSDFRNIYGDRQVP